MLVLGRYHWWFGLYVLVWLASCWVLWGPGIGWQCHFALKLSQNCYTIQLSHQFLEDWLFVVLADVLTLSWMDLVMHILHIQMVPGIVLCLPWPVSRMYLWRIRYLKKIITLCIMQFFSLICTGCHVHFFFIPCRKIINFLIILLSIVGLIFEFLFILDLSCLYCPFTCPLLWSAFIESQLILSSCNLSQASLPNNSVIAINYQALQRKNIWTQCLCELL